MRGVTLSWLLAALALPLTAKPPAVRGRPAPAARALRVQLAAVAGAQSALGGAGTISLVNWRYTLSRPAPSGLVVRLCASQRCVELDGASGSTRGLANVAADETLHLALAFRAGRVAARPAGGEQ